MIVKIRLFCQWHMKRSLRHLAGFSTSEAFFLSSLEILGLLLKNDIAGKPLPGMSRRLFVFAK